MELPRRRPRLLIDVLNEKDVKSTRLEKAKRWLAIAEGQIGNAQANLEGTDKAEKVRKWTRVASAAINRIEESEKK